jgi:hypothetical protein
LDSSSVAAFKWESWRRCSDGYDKLAKSQKAVEDKFGDLNLAKLLDLDTMKKKLSDSLSFLTKDIDLKPLLTSIKSLFDIFDAGTESGKDLKELVTWLGQGAVDSLSAAMPAAKGFIEAMIGGALDLEIGYLDLKIQFLETFGPQSVDNLKVFALGVDAAKISMAGLAKAGKEVEIVTSNMLKLAALVPHSGKSAGFFESVQALALPGGATRDEARSKRSSSSRDSAAWSSPNRVVVGLAVTM